MLGSGVQTNDNVLVCHAGRMKKVLLLYSGKNNSIQHALTCKMGGFSMSDTMTFGNWRHHSYDPRYVQTCMYVEPQLQPLTGESLN